MIYLVLVTVLIILVLIGFYYFRRGESRKIKRLKQRYILLSHMPPEVAEETLNLHLENLRKKFPGRSMEWYLEKIIYDLERERS